MTYSPKTLLVTGAAGFIGEYFVHGSILDTKLVEQYLTEEQVDTAPAFTEQYQYLPNSSYAASKASSDHLVRSYHHTYGLDTAISNSSNNYRSYQFPEKLIPIVIANCLGGKPLPIYGDGKQICNWLYVGDHNRGIISLSVKAELITPTTSVVITNGQYRYCLLDLPVDG